MKLEAFVRVFQNSKQYPLCLSYSLFLSLLVVSLFTWVFWGVLFVCLFVCFLFVCCCFFFVCFFLGGEGSFVVKVNFWLFFKVLSVSTLHADSSPPPPPPLTHPLFNHSAGSEITILHRKQALKISFGFVVAVVVVVISVVCTWCDVHVLFAFDEKMPCCRKINDLKWGHCVLALFLPMVGWVMSTSQSCFEASFCISFILGSLFSSFFVCLFLLACVSLPLFVSLSLSLPLSLSVRPSVCLSVCPFLPSPTQY